MVFLSHNLLTFCLNSSARFIECEVNFPLYAFYAAGETFKLLKLSLWTLMPGYSGFTIMLIVHPEYCLANVEAMQIK